MQIPTSSGCKGRPPRRHRPGCNACPVKPSLTHFVHLRGAGLRQLSRTQLDSLCTLASCEIVNTRSCAAFDSYVLSESSMFVHPTKFVIKTCGTTTLLACVPALIAMAADVGLAPRAAKYSRASYKFPAVQPAPHQGFESEMATLETAFAPTLGHGTAQVLGDRRSGLQWHVWAASRPTAGVRPSDAPRTTLEVRCPLA
jgi:S-adenosylmethionine decarboxylase